MTQEQIEARKAERKAEQEVFRHLRATRRKIRKEQERIGLKEYEARSNRKMIEGLERYCRENPGVFVVKIGHGYMLKDSEGIERYCREHPGTSAVKTGEWYTIEESGGTGQP
jgi:predicted membrane-bound dolichyl-phosphate-mannose-protein mannosyltransferase